MTRQKPKKGKKAVKGQNKKQVKKKLEKLWGLETRTFNRGSRNFLDQDYVGDLSDKEKIWLSKFNEEWYGNKLSPKTKRSKAKRKEIYDQTNARNRDVHTVHYKIYDRDQPNRGQDNENASSGGVNTTDSIFDVNRRMDYNYFEEASIDYFDFKRLVEQYLETGMDEEEARAKALSDLGL